MNFDFDGLGVIVTGAGSGIGRATALYLASQGADVLGVDVREDAAAQTAAASGNLKGSVTPHAADVTDPAHVQAYADRADRLFPRLWGFHNNAGVGGAHKPITDMTVVEWQSVIDVNLNSLFYGLKFVVPFLERRDGGAIVITGSLLSLKGAPRRADYAASKHAALGITRTAAAECAPLGIKVNCICPGPIGTPLQAQSEVLLNREDPLEERRRFEASTPIGRYGTTDEIARTVAFLLSPDVPYLTGAAVTVDGGLRAV